MTQAESVLDKIAIVTGGSRGIGRAIALELALRGAHVLITYNNARQDADDVALQIERLGRQVITIQGRGTDREAPERIVQAAVQKWGRIDIIVNNAGCGDDAYLKDITHELWDKIFDTNLRFPAFLVKASLPYLGPAPRIVNISSVAARVGYPAMAIYSSSKAALEGLTRVLASELGQEYNLTINCVNPGPVATDMWLKDTHQDVLDIWEGKKKETPAAARIATVDDIAQIVCFLCEEKSRWSTGSVVNANGGLVTV